MLHEVGSCKFQEGKIPVTGHLDFRIITKSQFISYSFPCVVVLSDLKTVPSDLPSDIVNMDLSRNIIKHLRPKQFLLSKDLKQLNLSSNNLQKIETGMCKLSAYPFIISIIFK